MATFRPSRLYHKQQRWTAEAMTLWGLVSANAAVLVVAKSDAPEVRDFVLTHLRTSVEALHDGRYHTLVTSIVSHCSAVHCAINLAVLLAFRRVQQLQAAELLALYLMGGVAGSLGHVAHCWFDAGGLDFGLRYALNTPSYMGCSGAVAAITAYKLVFEPGAVPLLLVVPLPLLVIGFLYLILEVKQLEYCDGPPPKLAGAAVGLLAALVSLARKSRRPVWLPPRKSPL